jgi:hypothetical protein
VMVAAKSDGATLEAADMTMMVLGSAGSGVAMVEVRSGPESGSVPGADGVAPGAGRAEPVEDGPTL